jgi:hypothetical protein
MSDRVGKTVDARELQDGDVIDLLQWPVGLDLDEWPLAEFELAVVTDYSDKETGAVFRAGPDDSFEYLTTDQGTLHLPSGVPLPVKIVERVKR